MGKYYRFWAYDDTEAFLSKVDNKGRYINQAIQSSGKIPPWPTSSVNQLTVSQKDAGSAIKPSAAVTTENAPSPSTVSLEGSSVVERPTVNREVAGSSPASPANDALSSNGRTPGFGPGNLGSNPSEAAKPSKPFRRLKRRA